MTSGSGVVESVEDGADILADAIMRNKVSLGKHKNLQTSIQSKVTREEDTGNSTRAVFPIAGSTTANEFVEKAEDRRVVLAADT